MLSNLRLEVCSVMGTRSYSGFDWLQYILAYGKPDRKFLNRDGVTFFDMIKAKGYFTFYLFRCSKVNKFHYHRDAPESTFAIASVILENKDNLTIPIIYQAFGIHKFIFREMACLLVFDGVFCCRKDLIYYIVDNNTLTFNDTIDESCELDIVKAIKRVFQPSAEPNGSIKTSLDAFQMIVKGIKDKEEELHKNLGPDNFGDYLKLQLLYRSLCKHLKKHFITRFAEIPTTIDELFWAMVDTKSDEFSKERSDGIRFENKRYYLQEGKRTVLDFLRADKISVADIDDRYELNPVYLKKLIPVLV